MKSKMHTDFILSRQAMLCSPKTIQFYHFTASKFVKYLEENVVTRPEELSARYIHTYLGFLAERNLATHILTDMQEQSKHSQDCGKKKTTSKQLQHLKCQPSLI